MATGARGESTIQVGDREIKVLFTNRALADAERAIGKTTLQLARGMQQDELGIGDMVILLRVGMEAARKDAREPGPSISMNAAFDVMDTAGFMAVSVAAMEAVAAVLTFGGDGVPDESPNPQATRS